MLSAIAYKLGEPKTLLCDKESKLVTSSMLNFTKQTKTT